jgi:cobalt-zinc-cadmium efflux system protein
MRGMPHDHHHAGHNHASKDFSATFAIAAALNIGLVALQVVFGLLGHSMALLADAGHNAGDALGLLFAWGAHVLAKRTPTPRYTYGFRSASILASLLNAVILLIATGAIAVEAVRRFLEPAPVQGLTVIAVAAIAIVLNGVAALLLMAGKHDLNVRGAFLHMIADAGVSFGVVIAGVLIYFTGWNWIDPVTSLVISGVIVWGTWGLLRESASLSLNAMPAEIHPNKVRGYLEGLPGVERIHDLHVWAMSTTETALTCHLVIPRGHPGDAFIEGVCHELHDRFRIEHPTLQIELGDAGECALSPEHTV